MGKPADVLAGVHELLAVADVVKVSQEDLDWLMPGFTPDEVHRGLARPGAGHRRDHPRRGRGGRQHPSGLHTRRPGVPVTVIDTVGAGDTFSAALLAGLYRRRLLGGGLGPPCSKITPLDPGRAAGRGHAHRGDHLLPARGRPAHRPGRGGPPQLGRASRSWTAGDGPRSFRHPSPTCTITAGDGDPARDLPLLRVVPVRDVTPVGQPPMRSAAPGQQPVDRPGVEHPVGRAPRRPRPARSRSAASRAGRGRARRCRR